MPKSYKSIRAYPETLDRLKVIAAEEKMLLSEYLDRISRLKVKVTKKDEFDFKFP